jgi:hypothetical protein
MTPKIDDANCDVGECDPDSGFRRRQLRRPTTRTATPTTNDVDCKDGADWYCDDADCETTSTTGDADRKRLRRRRLRCRRRLPTTPTATSTNGSVY